MKKIALLLSYLILFTSVGFAQCASVSARSTMADNPTSENLNGTFRFDYKIESIIETKKDDKLNRIIADYYVNTSDGSIFIPKELMDQFSNAHAIEDNLTFEGAVWFADGKMIYYLNDVTHHQKRAFVAPTHATGSSSNMMIDNLISDQAFIGDINALPNSPEPLPDWFWRNGNTEGYGNFGVSTASSQTHMSVYADANSSNIKTNTLHVGFLVGIYKNFRNDSCNRLVVYTKIYPKDGGYIVAALKSMNRERKSFNGEGYKPMGGLTELIGSNGDGISNMNDKMREFESRIIVLANKINRLQQEKEDCRKDEIGGSHYCTDYYNPLINRAKEQSKKLQKDLMKNMGIEDMIKN
jgi:hypothetical protein